MQSFPEWLHFRTPFAGCQFLDPSASCFLSALAATRRLTVTAGLAGIANANYRSGDRVYSCALPPQGSGDPAVEQLPVLPVMTMPDASVRGQLPRYRLARA